MKIIILDDYQHAIENLDCFQILKKYNVQMLHQTEKDPKVLAEKLQGTDIPVLTRGRTEINEMLLSQLPI